MTNPLTTLREALGEANNALGWASSMLIEGVEFYKVREVLHAAQKDAMKCHQALTRAEAALRELESEHRYTVEEVLEMFASEVLAPGHHTGSAVLESIKRRPAERIEKNG